MAHEVQADFKVNAAPGLAAIERLSAGFDRISRTVGTLAAVGGSLAGAFSLQKIVETTKEHYGAVKRLSQLTGLSTEKADGLTEAFGKVGIGIGEAEQILLGMSRRASMMDLSMQGVMRSGGGTKALFRALGVDIRKGPEEALIRLSALYRAGKVDVTQLGAAFGVPRTAALDFANLLRRGPEYLKETIAEAKKFGIREDQMKAFSRMKLAGAEAAEAFEQMQVVIGGELLPILAELMESATAKIKEWMPHVRAFGAFLRDNLSAALRTVVTIGKAMIANYAIMKATAALQLKAVGAAPGAPGGFGVSGLLGHLKKFALGGAAPGYGAIARTGNVLGRVPGLAGTFGGFAGMGNVTMLLRVFSAVGRLTLIGAAAMIAWKAFGAIRDNALGVRDRLLEFWNRLKGHFAVIAKLFAPVGKLFGKDGAVGKFFTVIVVGAIDALMMAVDGLMQFIEMMVIFWKRVIDEPSRLLHPIDTLGDAAIEAAKMHRDAMKAQESERLATRATDLKTPAERGGTSFNFPNARFDIVQKFEEGYDPDRIAVAFANDIAALGERRLQSGFSPLYAVR